MWEKIEKYLRIALLVLSLLAVVGPAALGVGMLLISVIFCDSGPFQRCFDAGLMFLGGIWFCAALPLPVVVALIRNKRELGWYMYLYPFLMLALAWLAYVKGAVAMGMAKVLFEYAGLALVAFAWLLLRRISLRQGLPPDLPRV